MEIVLKEPEEKCVEHSRLTNACEWSLIFLYRILKCLVLWKLDLTLSIVEIYI